MAEEQQKGKVIPIYHPFKQSSRLKTRRWINLAIIALIVIAAVLGSIFYTGYTNKNHQAAVSRSVRLIYANAPQGQVAITDNTGKVVAHDAIPKNSNVRYEALSADGTVLLSLNAPGPLTSYQTINEASQPLNAKAAKSLLAADFVNDSHHIVFMDVHTLAFVSCPAGKTCKLIELDLASGKATTVVDTGLKKSGFTSYAYLLGKSDDGKTLYLRVNGKNNLGKESNAVFMVNSADGKSTGSIKVPQSASFNLSLSPDQKKLAFATLDTDGTKIVTVATKLHVISMANGQDTATSWPHTGVGYQGGALQWSPDSSKVLFSAGMGLSAAGAKPSATQSYIAYLDIRKNQVVDLQKFSNVKNGGISTVGWLDNGTVIYSMITFNDPTKPSSIKYSTFRLSLSSRSTDGFIGPQATLLQTAYR